MPHVCTACKKTYSNNSWQCPHCGSTPEMDGRYPLFSPELAQSTDGFDPGYFEILSELEAGSFWFRARNSLIMWAIGKYFPNAKSLLEIGCGTGYVLSGIERHFPHLKLYGSEVLSEGLRYAGKRVDNAVLLQMDVRRIPFDDEFDVIGGFDLIEHMEEDEPALSEMFRAVRTGGGIILTVPQHAFLWSHTDDYAHHYRRYSLRELKTKVQKAGFKVIRHTSFVSFLMPLMLVARILSRKSHAGEGVVPELKTGVLIDALLQKFMDLERVLIQSGISMPFGGSLMIIAKKL